jgi:lipopolysaccharide/colanic/teichoic acid biosynthesis glycosyltransferase
VKRGFDLVAGSLLLVASVPLLGLLAAATWLSGVRPVLFHQVRVTKDGAAMKLTKVRTVNDTDADTQWAVSPGDCTRLGHLLRTTHLDELPQLVNVVRGEMSLVGPRPERPYYATRFADLIPGYADRHRVAAGLTGWAQVHGLSGDTSIPERARFDNYYIEHWSLWLDLTILARTMAEPLASLVRLKGP